jgi:hypothetical protein
MRISHVHPRCSGYMPCSPTPEVSSPPAHERWRGWCLRAFRHPRPPHKSVLTGLNRFNLPAYGLHPPCLRLTHAVAGVSPRLGMACVGSTLCQSHLQRQAAVRFVAHRKLIAMAGTKPVLVVLNAIPARGDRQQQARQAVEAMELSVCPIALGNRAAFGDAGILGQTALEFEPSGKAAEESRQLYKYISRLLDK